MNRVIKLLLVEDDNVDAIDLQRTLDRMGILYKIKIARNGEEAVRFLEASDNQVYSGNPDILLLDLNMPRMNGVECLQAIRSRQEWKDIRVFVLTTSDEHEDKAAVRRLGIAGYITKPFKTSNSGSMDAFNLMIDMMNI